jgi:hypothetical protein
VTLEDVPASLPDLDFTEQEENGVRLTSYTQGTNGLVYQQLITSLPSLPPAQLPLLPLYTRVLTEVGLGEQDYLAVQQRQAATVGGISASTAMRGAVDDEQALQACFVLSSRALARNVSEQIALMQDNLLQVRFDEPGRLRELISQQRARREQSVTGSGHGLAMTAASAGMSPLARLQHELTGLEGLRQLKTLDDGLANDSELQQFTAGLLAIHEQVTRMPRQLLAIADEHAIEAVAREALAAWSAVPTAADSGASFHAEPIREPRREFWLANTQVNFCARAYPTVPVGHPDAAALTVLGGFLRNGFLHRCIREQGGAYGGGASQDSGIAAFRFFSYRDPRLLETLQDFDRAIAWMLESTHQPESLEEAVLGVIGSLDKPGSPAGEAKQHFHNRLFGRSHQQREQFRRAVLAVSLEDLRRVTEQYLNPAQASTAVVSNRKQLETLGTAVEELGLTVQQL